MKEFKVKVRLKEYKSPNIKVIPSVRHEDGYVKGRVELLSDIGKSYDMAVKSFEPKEMGYCFICWDANDLQNAVASWYTAGIPMLDMMPSYLHTVTSRMIASKQKGN